MKENTRFILTIFGASGDLTARKLIPALINLYDTGLLQIEDFLILGVSRTKYTDEEFRKVVVRENNHIKNEDNKKKIDQFQERVYYQSIDTKSQDDYKYLKAKLDILSSQYKFPENYLFYLSTPPSMFDIIASGLSGQRLGQENNGTFKRLIIEKPFGYDLKSSRELNEKIHTCFKEDQIYRIDHYLGKETVQNLLATRFSNSIFEPLWNHNFIHHIEITASESIGVEKRGGYYESSGALRDMVQNHLFNLVAMVAMEPPVNLSAKAIRDESIKVFQSIRPFNKDIKKNVIRGQYTESHVRGEYIKGYRSETGVSYQSKTETYVAMKLFIDNWRWAGIPFYIRTGKRLPTRVTEIVIHFKSTPQFLYGDRENEIDKDNVLVFRIQPDEGILLKFGIKVPGAGNDIKSVNMDFHYNDHSDFYIPEAYERLLLDAVQGDATLYPRNDAVEQAWAIVDPILEQWKLNEKIPVYGYPSGTWGPEQAIDLIDGKGIDWRYPCKNLTDDGIYCEL